LSRRAGDLFLPYVKLDPHHRRGRNFVPAGIFVPGAPLRHLDPARSRSGDVVNFLVVNSLVKEGDHTTPLCG
jgi:hypothetical protein